MQPQTQSMLIKQQKQFQLVQSNSQFFTVVRKCPTQNFTQDAQSLSQYIKNLSDIKIDYQYFSQCFIQIAYLIYTTKYYGLNPHIDQQSVRIQQNYNWMNQKRFSIIIYYKFNQQARDNSYSSIVRDIYKYLKISYQQYQKKSKQTSIDAQHKTAIKTFFQQVAIIQSKLLQLNEDEARKQIQFFLWLEETDLFRDNSLLLKIKNNSILDFIKCKFGKFKGYKQIDINLTNQLLGERKKNKSDPEQLKKKQQDIQKNITNFFQQIVQTNPNKYKLKVQPSQYSKTKLIFIVQDIPSEPFANRLAKLLGSNDTILIQSQSVPQTSNYQFQKPQYMEYQIQYNSDRNSLCVRLILSTIACSNESIDYIMFQSNVLTFQSANISLEFIQDRVPTKVQPKGSQKSMAEERSKQSSQQKKRNLAFRGASCFHNKQPILQKILTLMDLTMIAGKICEPELLTMRKNFMSDKDPQKLSIVYDKLNHYAKIFLKCAKKIYNE